MTRHHTPQVEIQTLPLDAPWRWLQKGWQDFKQAPLIGLLHGCCWVVPASAQRIF